MDLCADTAGPAQIDTIMYSFRTEGPKIAYRFVPPDDGPRCARPPVGRLSRPPLPSILAEPYGGATSRVPAAPPRCARTHPRETERTPARRRAAPAFQCPSCAPAARASRGRRGRAIAGGHGGGLATHERGARSPPVSTCGKRKFSSPPRGPATPSPQLPPKRAIPLAVVVGELLDILCLAQLPQEE